MAIETQTAKLRDGELLPLFRLAAVNREGQRGPGEYKQHRNLVLIFLRSAECRACRELLREIAAHYGEYQRMETEVLAVSADSSPRLRRLAEELSLPFPVLSDSERRASDLYLKQTEGAEPEAAVFVADRWGAVFTSKIVGHGHDLLDEAEIRQWLEFIEMQCEECFPSEWPL